MKNIIPILIAVALCSGCIARKIVTIPAGIAVKTTGKIAVETTKAVIPGGGEEK